MFFKISGACTALFLILFFILSTLSPIVQSSDKYVKITDSVTAMAHTSYTENFPYIPLNYDDVRAMWFPYFEYKDILQGKSEKEFENNIYNRFNNAKQLGINTVYIHARAHGDAYYYSDIFPMASRCSGTLGKKISFDPLDIITDTAHKLGLSVHAWINPLRLMSAEEISIIDNKYIIKQWYNDAEKNGTYIVNCDNTFYLNPAYVETRGLVCNGIDEILQNYDIDGIHIDDYFYPTTDTSFDEKAFSLSGCTDLTLWRYENTNALVKEIYNTVKNYSTDIQFGISPAATDIANQNLYADVNCWASQNGYCDYIVPQIYFGYTSESAPFSTIFDLWKQKCQNSDVKLIIGVCTYKYTTESDEWSDPTLTARQIQDIITDSQTGGVAIYSYSATFEPQNDFSLYENMRNNIKNTLIPED